MDKQPDVSLTFSEPFPPGLAGGFPCEPYPSIADLQRVTRKAQTNRAELGIIDDPEPKVTIATDPAAKKPEVTIWRVGEDGQEYADFPMSTPEDLERLNKELPLTAEQLDKLTKKIARNMLRDAIKDTRQKKRIKNAKAAKLARKRGR